jgi:hypothetical protein
MLFPLIIALIALVPVLAVVRGLTLLVLWGWLITPVFTGAPDLNLASAMGISVFIAFLTSNLHQDQDKKPDAKLTKVVGSEASAKLFEALIKATTKTFVICGFAIFFAWILHFFI